MAEQFWNAAPAPTRARPPTPTARNHGVVLAGHVDWWATHPVARRRGALASLQPAPPQSCAARVSGSGLGTAPCAGVVLIEFVSKLCGHKGRRLWDRREQRAHGHERVGDGRNAVSKADAPRAAMDAVVFRYEVVNSIGV